MMVRRTMLAFATVVSAVGMAHAAPDSFLTPMGPVADAQRDHLVRVVAITMLAIVPVLIGVPLIVLRYRRRTGQGQHRPHPLYRPDWQFSGPLEIAMWGGPFVIIAVLGWWLWHESARLDPYAATGQDPLRVQAIGLDWKWLFIYPDQGFATLGEMAVPVGRPVQVALTTDTVMQSFRVSALAGQIYAMPGMQTQVNFTASRAGTAKGENTQYNGTGFAQQTFTLRALPGGDFAAWAGQSAAMDLDDATYARIARTATPAQTLRLLDLPAGPARFSGAPADLFDRVIARYHQGAALPAGGQPGADDYTETPPPAAGMPPHD